jgi:hypothetical protein
MGSAAVEIMTRSTDWQKALVVNDVSFLWTSIITVVKPFQLQAANWPLGIFDAGEGGEVGPNLIQVQPYCYGPAGSQFSMRMYGWRPVGMGEPMLGTLMGVWVPQFLVEFACIACNQPGINGRTIDVAENFCDTITLTQGSVGSRGEINSTGPGTDLIASAEVDLRGAKRFSFTFQQTDAVSMNSLWTTV